MTTLSLPTTRNIYWNGIALEVPTSWEVQIIALCHLSFEYDAKIVLELRWLETTGRNTESIIKRIIKQYQEHSAAQLNATSPPSEGDELYAHFQVQCYTTTGHDSPLLVFLIDQDEQLMFILHVHAWKKGEHPLKKIHSLGKARLVNGWQPWSIQDFQVSLPISYILSKYTMKAGLTVLEFISGKTILHLCRLSLAGQRLEKESIEALFTSLLGLDKEARFEYPAANSVCYRAQPSILQQIIIRLQRKKPFQLATFWHDQSNDRLLGCFMQGIAPLDQEQHATICDNYEIISIKKK